MPHVIVGNPATKVMCTEFRVRAILQRRTATLIGAERVLMCLEIASEWQVSIFHLGSIWWAKRARPPVAYRRPAI